MKSTDYKKYGLFVGIAVAFILLYRKKPKKVDRTKGIIDLAEHFIGVNSDKACTKFSSPDMEYLMKNIGWKKGDFWCMDFVKMIYYNAYINDNNIVDYIKTYFDSSSQKTFDNIENDSQGPFEITQNPKIADILILQKSTNRTQGHSGIIIEIIDDKYCYTIEGNTGNPGKAGYWVMKKKRLYTTGAGIGDNLYVRGIIGKK